MTDTITVTGVVGSDPRLHVTTQGLAITSFRLASTRRYFDRAKGTWEDGETNWYTVSGFRQLAQNAAASVRKGDRIVVQGRLRLRAWESGEKSGMAVEIEAASRATTGPTAWPGMDAPSDESAVIDEARAAGFADDIAPHGGGDSEGASLDGGSRLVTTV